MVVLRSETALWIVFGIAQIGIALWGLLRIALNEHIFPDHPYLKWGVAIAKLGAALVNLNGALLLLSMCRITLTALRTSYIGPYLPIISNSNDLHRWCGVFFIAGALIHIVLHVSNLISLSMLKHVHLGHPTLITGYVLTIFFLLISISSYWKSMKQRCFEVFQYVHWLVLPSMGLLIAHGLFCFLQDGRGSCAGSTTWMFLVGPLSLAVLETMIITIRSYRFCYICKVIEHPSKVIELQMRKPSFNYEAGQYVYVKVPRISYFQWHPFTLTSSPEEDHISIHIRVEGDWTRSLDQLLRTQTKPENIHIYIDGPYGCASQDYRNNRKVICIGAGIGQTPFASIMKSLWFQMNHPDTSSKSKVEDITFIGICRSTKSLEWFNEILQAIERASFASSNHRINLMLHVTGPVSMEEMSMIAAHHELGLPDPLTGLRSETLFGRPNFESLFTRWSQNSDFNDIGIVFCGPHTLGSHLRELCVRYSRLAPSVGSRVTFHYCEEHF